MIIGNFGKFRGHYTKFILSSDVSVTPHLMRDLALVAVSEEA